MLWAKIALVLVVGGGWSGSVLAQERTLASRLDPMPPRHAAHRQDRTPMVLYRLNTFVPEVRFDEEPLGDVLEWLRTHGIKNIVVHWSKIEELADVDASTPVSLHLSSQTLGEILDMVLEQASHLAYQNEGRLFYRIINGVIEISNRAHYAHEIVVRTYPVENLLQSLIHYDDAPTVSVAGGGQGGGGGGRRGGGGGQNPRGGGNRPPGGGGSGNESGGGIFEGGGEGELIDFEALREEQIEKLIEVIKNIRPETWAGGRGTISEFRGQLVIAQTIEMHELIGGQFRLVASR